MEGPAYFGEYKCGCVSRLVRKRRDVLSYCGKHGDDRRDVHCVTATDWEIAEDAKGSEWNPEPRAAGGE